MRTPPIKRTASTGLPFQNLYDEIAVCNTCNVECHGDYCPKCGAKVTRDSVDPRREKDLVDLVSKTTIKFPVISIQSALEIMNNGDCGD